MSVVTQQIPRLASKDHSFNEYIDTANLFNHRITRHYTSQEILIRATKAFIESNGYLANALATLSQLEDYNSEKLPLLIEIMRASERKGDQKSFVYAHTEFKRIVGDQQNPTIPFRDIDVTVEVLLDAENFQMAESKFSRKHQDFQNVAWEKQNPSTKFIRDIAEAVAAFSSAANLIGVDLLKYKISEEVSRLIPKINTIKLTEVDTAAQALEFLAVAAVKIGDDITTNTVTETIHDKFKDWIVTDQMHPRTAYLTILPSLIVLGGLDKPMPESPFFADYFTTKETPLLKTEIEIIDEMIEYCSRQETETSLFLKEKLLNLLLSQWKDYPGTELSFHAAHIYINNVKFKIKDCPKELHSFVNCEFPALTIESAELAGHALANRSRRRSLHYAVQGLYLIQKDGALNTESEREAALFLVDLFYHLGDDSSAESCISMIFKYAVESKLPSKEFNNIIQSCISCMVNFKKVDFALTLLGDLEIDLQNLCSDSLEERLGLLSEALIRLAHCNQK